jgi:DNA end-binding protein Ku
LTDKELKRANVKATQSIDIQSFVDLDNVDVRYFEKPYYLKPTKGGEKPYALLYKTLLQTKKIGIATVVIRTKQHLAAVMPRDGVLILEILRFADELRDKKASGVTTISAKLSPREMKMAKDLVASMTTDWDPSEYHDTYREDLMKLIRYKIKHGETESILAENDTETESHGKVVDLMPLLRKSLEKTKPSKRVKRGSKKVSQQA